MVVKTLGSNDTPSREISHRNATRTIRGGDFSTPLRFGRNDEGGVISSGGTHRYGWQKSEPSEPFELTRLCFRICNDLNFYIQ